MFSKIDASLTAHQLLWQLDVTNHSTLVCFPVDCNTSVAVRKTVKYWMNVCQMCDFVQFYQIYSWLKSLLCQMYAFWQNSYYILCVKETFINIWEVWFVFLFGLLTQQSLSLSWPESVPEPSFLPVWTCFYSFIFSFSLTHSCLCFSSRILITCYFPSIFFLVLQ